MGSTNTDGTTDILTLHADADGTNNGVVSIKLMGNAGNHAAFIKGGHTTNGDTILTFHTDAHDSGINPEERLRINSSGQLITGGTATPYPTRSVTIQPVTGQTNTYLSIVAGNTTSTSGLTFGDTAGSAAGNYAGMFEYYHSDDSLRYSQNASEKLRIDSSGRLLIGTTTEGSGGADELTIATSGDTGMTIRSGTSSAGGIYFSDGTSGGDEYRGVLSYNHSGNYMRFYTDGTEKLRITSTGSLALGNTHAAKKVHISTTGNQKILIDPNYNNNSGGSSNSEADANNIVESILIRTSFGSNAASQTNAGHKWGIKFQGYNGNDFTQAVSKCAGVFAVSELSLIHI